MLELDGGWIPGQSASTHVNRYDTREENVQRGRKEGRTGKKGKKRNERDECASRESKRGGNEIAVSQRMREREREGRGLFPLFFFYYFYYLVGA